MARAQSSAAPPAAALSGLAAAALFGVGAPLAKLLLPSAGPVLLAGLLYLGAGAGLFLARGRRSDEAPVRRADLPALSGAILFGGLAGPVLLLWGLTHLTAVAGSLLLNLEAPLTIALAVALFGEHLGRTEALGAILIVAGSAFLATGGTAPAEGLGGSLAGAASIALACLCWAVDNNLTQRLSLKDPVQVVQIKSLAAGAANTIIGLAAGERMHGAPLVGAALLLGVFSYGLSLVLHLRAQRALGAARQAALFATAPFVGALAAVPLLHESLHARDLAAGALMALGVFALVRASHGHRHTHQALEHEHAHVHDEHHQHAHDGAVDDPHSHAHRHEATTHEHPHVSDAHHRHKH